MRKYQKYPESEKSAAFVLIAIKIQHPDSFNALMAPFPPKNYMGKFGDSYIRFANFCNRNRDIGDLAMPAVWLALFHPSKPLSSLWPRLVEILIEILIRCDIERKQNRKIDPYRLAMALDLENSII